MPARRKTSVEQRSSAAEQRQDQPEIEQRGFAFEERPTSNSNVDVHAQPHPAVSISSTTSTAPVVHREKQEKPHYLGHRQRLRERFMQGGPDALPDYELLELVLFAALRQGDTKPIAKDLLAEFGTFAGVINASPERLKKINKVGDAVIAQLKIIQAAAVRVAKTELTDKPLLTSWSQVLDYLRMAQGYEDQEVFRILFLDKKNRLIADDVQGRGTVDHTPVYIREVVKRALELSATALILVHNHPSGDPTPSQADIDMTQLIIAAAKPLGVTVHDHVIVGREGHSSLRSLGHI